MKVFYIPHIHKLTSFHGFALRWFVIIDKKSSCDLLLHDHERIHISQQKHYGFFVYLLRYFTDSYFRAEMEYQAFRVGSMFTEEQAKEIMARKYFIPEHVIEETI